MCYFTSKKNRKNIHRRLKKHDETNDVCESLKKFKNTNKSHKSYKEATEINKI